MARLTTVNETPAETVASLIEEGPTTLHTLVAVLLFAIAIIVFHLRATTAVVVPKAPTEAPKTDDAGVKDSNAPPQLRQRIVSVVKEPTNVG